MKTLFLAESQNHVRRAIQLVLEQHAEIVLIGEADHAESLLAQVCTQPPEVIVLGWNLAGANHIRLIATLRKHCPATKIVAMSVKPELEVSIREYGVDGFISKQIPPEEFIAALLDQI